MIIEVITGLLVALTAFYAWTTYRIMAANERVVETMREQGDSLTRPYITINAVVESNSMFYLHITNTGRTAAKDVSLTLDRDFYRYGKKEHKSLREATAFQQPIEQMPPGFSLTFPLAPGPTMLGRGADPDLTPTVFTITARYTYGSTLVEEATTIDLRPYTEGTTRRSDVAKEIEKLHEKIEKIATKL